MHDAGGMTKIMQACNRPIAFVALGDTLALRSAVALDRDSYTVVSSKLGEQPRGKAPCLKPALRSYAQTRAAHTVMAAQRDEGIDSTRIRGSRRKMLSRALVSFATVFAAVPGPLSAAGGGASGVGTSSGATAIAKATAAAEGQSGFISGIAVSLVKQTLLYPVDTVKVRLQTTPLQKGESMWTRADLFKNLYRGFLFPLLFNAPAGGVFFAAKDFVKSALSTLGNVPSTIIAIFAAQFPYWMVRQPSEILKVRKQAGSEAEKQSIQEWLVALQDTAQQLDIRKPGSLQKLFQGFGSNVAYTFPADALKFVVYDYLKEEVKKRTGAKAGPLQAALLGAVGSIVAQVLTTPLDVARNRIMKTSKDDSTDYSRESFLSAMSRIYKEEGPPGLMLGLTPRVFRAIFSGAIQFSTYEFTKAKVG